MTVRFALWVGLLVFFANDAGRAQPVVRSSYLIAGNIDGLVIFDRYERRLSAKAQSLFDPYTPMRIVEPVRRMGDGLSKMMVVEVEHVRYGLLLDDASRLLMSSGARDVRIVHDAVVLEDTARVSAIEGVRIERPGGGIVHLTRGSLVKRYFTMDNKLFVGSDTEPRHFGWMPVVRSATLEPVPVGGREASVSGVTGLLRDRVERRLAQVNGYLRRLYRMLAEKTGRAVDPPLWRIKAEGRAILCTLEGAPSVDAHAGSTRMLANEFRSFALGPSAEVDFHPGVIEIRSSE